MFNVKPIGDKSNHLCGADLDDPGLGVDRLWKRADSMRYMPPILPKWKE
jgi:hypothetical protein